LTILRKKDIEGVKEIGFPSFSWPPIPGYGYPCHQSNVGCPKKGGDKRIGVSGIRAKEFAEKTKGRLA